MQHRPGGKTGIVVPHPDYTSPPDAITALVIGRAAFFDVFGIVVNHTPPPFVLVKALGSMCRGGASARPVEWIDEKTGEVVKPPHPAWWVRCFQPSDAALAILQSHFWTDDSTISHVEAALDLCTQSKPDASMVTAWINRHLVRKHRRHNELLGPDGCMEHEVTYSSQRRWRVKSHVTYGDRPSKITGQPCCHIEYRFLSARYVRQLEAKGEPVRRPADLIGFDHRSFWQEHLTLHAFDLVKLGRKIRGRGNAKKSDAKTIAGSKVPYSRDAVAGQTIARIAGHQLNAKTSISAQAILAIPTLFPELKLRSDRLTNPIDSTPFLPPVVVTVPTSPTPIPDARVVHDFETEKRSS